MSMRKIREVLRLTHELGLSVRQVCEATGVGKTAVSEYVNRAKVVGITWPTPPEMTPASRTAPLRSSTRASGCRTGSIAPSPTLYNNICSDGAFVATISDSVEVTRPNEPATPMPAAGSTVFGMADPPYGVPKPLAVRWTAQRSLEITIPNGLSPGQAIAKGWRFASSGAHTNPMSLIGPTRTR